MRERWTQDRIAQLSTLWIAGKSCNQIARIMGRVSRNAIIGKVHRLGLHELPRKMPPPDAARRHRGQRTGARPALIPVAPRAPRLAPGRPPVPRNLPLLDLSEQDCRYPVSGQGAATLFCGAPKAHGEAAHCPHHHALCWYPRPIGTRGYGRKQNAASVF